MIGLMSSETHTSQITSRYYLYIIRIHWEDVFQKSWTVIYPFFSVQYAVLSSSTEFCHTLGIMHISAGDFWLFWYFWQQTGHVLALLARILQCMPVSASTVQNWLTKFVQYSFCSLAFLPSDFFLHFLGSMSAKFPMSDTEWRKELAMVYVHNRQTYADNAKFATTRRQRGHNRSII